MILRLCPALVAMLKSKSSAYSLLLEEPLHDWPCLQRCSCTHHTWLVVGWWGYLTHNWGGWLLTLTISSVLWQLLFFFCAAGVILTLLTKSESSGWVGLLVDHSTRYWIGKDWETPGVFYFLHQCFIIHNYFHILESVWWFLFQTFWCNFFCIIILHLTIFFCFVLFLNHPATPEASILTPHLGHNNRFGNHCFIYHLSSNIIIMHAPLKIYQKHYYNITFNLSKNYLNISNYTNIKIIININIS